MSVMVSKFFAFKKIFAAILPLFLFCHFAVCLSVCESENIEAVSSNPDFSASAQIILTDAEDCAVESLPILKASEQNSFCFQTIFTAHSLNFHFKRKSTATYRIVLTTNYVFAIPPLQRLPILRI